ncbi:LacI family DNA-binding transcriptional regulator [Methylobacillus sp. Pita1]|uniref:LacI family DNA-binding transcriptional regulator n=1 Tax=Methylobacillus sp. Pita1 TaxID=3382642 RepID=UPI0038B511F3
MSGKRKGLGRATVHDVAKLAGVSSITVSRYFKQPEIVSEVLRGRIAKAVAALDYLPNHAAGGLASTRGRIVAMVIPNISGPIFANTIQSFSDELNRHGYQLLLASSYFSMEKEESAVRAFLGWSPAALVLTSQYHSEGTERLIAKAAMPVVETWDYVPERKPVQVGFSHVEVGRQSVEYLHGKGYKRIAYVQNSLIGDLSALDRRDGYIARMNAYGLEPWVFVPTQADPFEAGRQAVNSLLLRQQPAEAIVFANDNLAAGGMLAGLRAGKRFPEDCAIFGFGNYAFSEMLLPSLTTIRPPAREIGEVAALRVLQALGETPADGPVQHLNLLDCELIARESA